MERRITIAVYIVIFAFLVFFLRLWDLQIIKGNEYRKIDERNRLRVIDIPAPRGIIYDTKKRALVKNIPTFDIAVVREDLPEDEATLSSLGRLIGLSADDIRKRLSRATAKPFQPVRLKQNVSFEEVARVEARKIDFPGLQVNVVGARQYIYGDSASHVVGYLGRLSIEQLNAPEYRNVPRESFIGQFGIEKVYDAALRGIAGKKIIEVDAVGSIIRVVRIQRPVKGRDINLTIDIDLQVEAEKSLEGKAGAVVALKPDTGEILALASAPSFDPNLFLRGISYKDWRRLVSDPRKPFLNRAIQSQYAPGSTFKIITAIAALEQGIVTGNTTYTCRGSIYFGRVFRCWKAGGHGRVRLYKALVESCDVYFYEIAKKLGIDTLAQYAFGFGLGRRTGIELNGEVPGFVPTSAWKLEKRHEKWYKGETLNTVIGQGYLSATPIQMAKLIAAVVNGGRLFKPHLLKYADTDIRPESIVKIKPENIRLVKKALMGVVADRDGTGRLARSEIVGIGGKTGTTQVVAGDVTGGETPDKYKDHAWFVAFAPGENPRIAVAVFVEHGGHGSTSAAPIAKRIIEAYYRQG
ncbi:MAG: penicillin-binding protein 2 [Deferribacteres bacterium]|nr:penicillin-binding protein 2 [Deferribacteres bacterium]